MPRWLRVLAFLLQFATLGLAIAFIVTRLLPERFAAAPAMPAPTPTNASGPMSYSEAVRKASPSVVNIYANRVVTEQPYRIFTDPVYQRYSGVPVGPARRRLTQNLGSGVIVRDDGYVLTNFHVVREAEDIFLSLWDGRVVPARVIGGDDDTDLAVLKIDGSGFPAITFSNGAALSVGDVVLAIGNPLGMGHTVTMGIVSATGRDQPNLSRYEDFIQTDAAINEGNSGGALVSARGELIGINTATARMSQAQGISFAIPASAGRHVLDEIIDHGYVIRGWMGAEFADAATSAAPTANAGPRGVQLMSVVPGGPADQAGLKPGDVLMKFNGEDVEDEGDLRNREAALKPGVKAQIEGQRAGLPFTADVVLVQRARRTPNAG